MDFERRIVLVVQGLFMSGELPGGVKLDDALKAEKMVLEDVHFASLPGVNLPSITVLTASVNAYGLGNHPTRAAMKPKGSEGQQTEKQEIQATEYEHIP